MIKKKKAPKSGQRKTVVIHYDRRRAPSEREAAQNFKVGFWKHQHKSNNKKGADHHPAYVYGLKGQDYEYLGITESEKSGHHKNIPLKKNPNPRQKGPAYLRHPDKEHYRNFTEYYPNWRFDADDYQNAVKKAKK